MNFNLFADNIQDDFMYHQPVLPREINKADETLRAMIDCRQNLMNHWVYSRIINKKIQNSYKKIHKIIDKAQKS